MPSLTHCISRTSILGAAWLLGCGQTVVSLQSGFTDAGTTTRPAVSSPGPAVGDAALPVQADVTSGLVLHLAFDEVQAGGVISDSSGAGHHGTPSPDPPTPSPATPPVGYDNPRSLSFDGVAQFVDLGNPETLNISGQMTICAWIRPSSLTGYRNIVAHGFRWDPAQEVALRIQDGSYEFVAWNSVDHLVRAPVGEGDLDNWRHVCGVFDGQSYRLYRDAVLVAEEPEEFVPMSIDAPWAVGGRSAGGPEEPRPFAGLIDEVRIYRRSLGIEAIRALFRQ
jgi:Concanavalin A-like lectin/glucanases superfamily